MLAAERVFPWVTTAGMVTPMRPVADLVGEVVDDLDRRPLPRSSASTSPGVAILSRRWSARPWPGRPARP